jgi:hypothetical protein
MLILEIFVFINNAASSQIYIIPLKTENKPPFRGAGGQTNRRII